MLVFLLCLFSLLFSSRLQSKRTKRGEGSDAKGMDGVVKVDVELDSLISLESI
jgi:hypothetical protein